MQPNPIRAIFKLRRLNSKAIKLRSSRCNLGKEAAVSEYKDAKLSIYWYTSIAFTKRMISDLSSGFRGKRSRRWGCCHATTGGGHPPRVCCVATCGFCFDPGHYWTDFFLLNRGSLAGVELATFIFPSKGSHCATTGLCLMPKTVGFIFYSL